MGIGLTQQGIGLPRLRLGLMRLGLTQPGIGITQLGLGMGIGIPRKGIGILRLRMWHLLEYHSHPPRIVEQMRFQSNQGILVGRGIHHSTYLLTWVQFIITKYQIKERVTKGII